MEKENKMGSRVKMDIYNDLTIAFSNKDYDSIVKYIKELISTQSECNNIISYMIEYYSEHALCSNVYILQIIVNKLKHIVNIPKKQTSQMYLSEIMDIALILLTITKDVKPLDTVVNNTVSEFEACISNYGNKKHEELKFLKDEGKVGNDIYTKLNVIYYMMRYNNKINVIQCVLYLLDTKSILVEDITFDEIKLIKKKGDIVWYLWKLLLLLTQIRNINEHFEQFVKCNLYLYTCLYQIKYRATRKNIIIFVFKILCSKNAKKYITSKEVKFKFANVQQSAQQGTKQINLDYLKCYTYVDQDLVESVKLDRNQNTQIATTKLCTIEQ